MCLGIYETGEGKGKKKNRNRKEILEYPGAVGEIKVPSLMRNPPGVDL